MNSTGSSRGSSHNSRRKSVSPISVPLRHLSVETGSADYVPINRFRNRVLFGVATFVVLIIGIALLTTGSVPFGVILLFLGAATWVCCCFAGPRNKHGTPRKLLV